MLICNVMKRVLKIGILFCFISLFYLPAIKAEDENSPGKYTISGYIKDTENGESLIGATVFVRELKVGAAANVYGFYSLSLPAGNYTIEYSFIGYTKQVKEIDLKSNTTINAELLLESQQMEEVTVLATRPDNNVKQTEMSTARLDIKTIRQIPALMGEVDIIKAIQMLPGVQSTSEGSSGFSVRGGGMDQNLIMLDEATVYNASHLMGFFSVFNNDAIRDVKLYKGDIPANFGGRLSSVMDIRMKEGNNKKFEVNGGVGLISSRLTLEGPIFKGKTSFLISGRRTYADLFFPLFSDTSLQKSKMYFYDLNLKINHEINKNNRLFLSAYTGRDIFGQKGSGDIGFGNQTATLRWNHLFSDKLFSNFTLVMANYNYSLAMEQSASDYHWKSKMLDYTAKVDFTYYLNPNNEVKLGFSSTYHDLEPCNAWMASEDSIYKVPYPKNYSLEHGAYISNQHKISDKLTVKYGIRYSLFQNIGTATIYQFGSDYKVTDTSFYKKGHVFNSFDGWEPRVGLNYALNNTSSVKASYSRTVQYMQLASNSTGGMPLDVWFPSSPNVKPQKADQYALGYFRNFDDNKIETSIEVYYKDMKDVVDFRDHAQLLMNPRMEGEIRSGTSTAYGLEFLIRKNSGKFNGWISYTLSKVTRKIAEINDGKVYPASFDKPHNINVIANYEISKRMTLSANWIYASGTPITAPVGTWVYENTINKIYSSRNGYRMRDYHRLDLSLIIKGKERPNRAWNGEWVFSIYNAYGRHNDWMLNFVEDNKNPGKLITERWYLPFIYFPGITYNFNF